MTKEPHPPSIKDQAFDCPHCGAYTTQYWFITFCQKTDKNNTPQIISQEDFEDIIKVIKTDKNLDEETKDRIIGWHEKKYYLLFFWTTTRLITTMSPKLKIYI